MSTDWDTDRLTAVGRAVCARYSGVDAAFVSGSLVEGFGNATSDIDVFLIGDEVVPLGQAATTLQYGEYAIEVDMLDDVRTDVEIWSHASATAALTGIADIDAADWTATLHLDRGRMEFAHRLRIGLPVVGAERVEALREKFDWDHFAAVLTQRFLYFSNGSVEDAIGAIGAKDACAAMLNSRIALGAAADALAASAGATNASPKWRHYRLTSHVSSEVAQRYLEAEIDTSSAPEDLLRGAKRRLSLTQAFTSEAMTRLLAYTNAHSKGPGAPTP
jgi:hypothetical protein